VHSRRSAKAVSKSVEPFSNHVLRDPAVVKPPPHDPHGSSSVAESCKFLLVLLGSYLQRTATVRHSL
jgi:hypothetical protein